MRAIIWGQTIDATGIRVFMSTFNRSTGKPDECWEWAGGIFQGKPYGRFCATVNGKKITHRAHQFSYWIHKGEIPLDLVIRHSCHNGKCVNPDHLSIGTNQDNTDDMIKAGRKKFRIGDECSWRKINQKDALEIRRLLENTIFSQRDIAKIICCTWGVVQSIANGSGWKHLGPRPVRPVGSCINRSIKKK